MAQMRCLTGSSILVLSDSAAQRKASSSCMYLFLGFLSWFGVGKSETVG
jgi:hypothetical protein